jgi:hypothetical protein
MFFFRPQILSFRRAAKGMTAQWARARFWHRNRVFLLSWRVTACVSSTIYCPAICTTFPHRSPALPPASSLPISLRTFSGVSASLVVPSCPGTRALSASHDGNAKPEIEMESRNRKQKVRNRNRNRNRKLESTPEKENCLVELPNNFVRLCPSNVQPKATIWIPKLMSCWRCATFGRVCRSLKHA